MHTIVDALPPPAPDYRRFLQALRRQRPDRVPLIELAVHPVTVAQLLGEPEPTAGSPELGRCQAARQSVRLLHRLGYDVAKVSAHIPFLIPRLHSGKESAASRRGWQDQHRGPIASREDVDSYPWPTADSIDFAPVDAAAAELPEGMRIIGFSGGILEFAMDLVGMTPFMIALRRDPELAVSVIDRVGAVVLEVFGAYCRRDMVCAVWLGDDLGDKSGLLVSPEVLRRLVLPWYRRLGDVAHRHGRPFLLHTCGETRQIMPALVREAGIDAKHSFQDAIQPVEEFIDEWGAEVAVLGGLDVHLLSTGTPGQIAARTHAILEHAARCGGYACGSGNSIPGYVPTENYLAMVRAVHRFNARAC